MAIHHPNISQTFALKLLQSFRYFDKSLTQSLAFLWQNAKNSFHKTKEEINEEAELIAKAQANPRFFGAIYERYYDSIFIFIDRRVSDEEATADICAQVFYKCLQNIHKFEFRGLPFSSWLFRIAVNEINQYFRNQKHRERSVRLKSEHVDFLCAELDTQSDAEENAYIVSKLLSSLKPDEVQFLELRFFEGRPFEEVGFILGLSAVNAKVKTYRILKKLKELAVKLKHH